MLKVAYNKENENLVYEIDRVERVSMTPELNKNTGIIEKYVGTLKDTSNNTQKENVEISINGFDSDWIEVPMNVVNTGTEINNQNKTVTPSNAQQTVTADSSYTGLGTVTVQAAPLETAEATPSTSAQTITATTAGKIGLSSVAVSAVTASIDANITAGNIKDGVTILGVTGTYDGGGGNTREWVDPSHLYKAVNLYKKETTLSIPNVDWVSAYNNLLLDIASTEYEGVPMVLKLVTYTEGASLNNQYPIFKFDYVNAGTPEAPIVGINVSFRNSTSGTSLIPIGKYTVVLDLQNARIQLNWFPSTANTVYLASFTAISKIDPAGTSIRNAIWFDYSGSPEEFGVMTTCLYASLEDDLGPVSDS